MYTDTPLQSTWALCQFLFHFDLIGYIRQQQNGELKASVSEPEGFGIESVASLYSCGADIQRYSQATLAGQSCHSTFDHKCPLLFAHFQSIGLRGVIPVKAYQSIHIISSLIMPLDRLTMLYLD